MEEKRDVAQQKQQQQQQTADDEKKGEETVTMAENDGKQDAVAAESTNGGDN